MGAWQAGHAERGTTRLKRSACAGAAAPESCAHSARHCLCSMTGTRWITTFKKLPTRRPTTAQATVNSTGEAAKTSIRRKRLCLDDRAQLENRQVHGDDESADQDA